MSIEPIEIFGLVFGVVAIVVIAWDAYRDRGL